MAACKDVKVGFNPRHVIRGCDSQRCNEIGVHWLRMSFNIKDLFKIKAWLDRFYGECDSDGYGLWAYDSRFFWPSGVSLNYDADGERCQKVHRGRVTLDCPGRACDELTGPDLLLLIEGFENFGGLCRRIDVFFDDYDRQVKPSDLHTIIDRNDYSGFRQAHKKQTLKSGVVVHDEVMFGRRGQVGSGRYVRIYDKFLESKGEKNCVRWEVEFAHDKAQKVFVALAGSCGDLDVFATICGALIGGSINFIHRNGDKNLRRLDVYDFWELIVESLGTLIIRTEKKQNTITGVIEWTERQVAPSLACVYRSFISEQQFFGWLRDILGAGEARMNAKQRHIVELHAKSMGYDPKINVQQQENDYARLMGNVR